MTADTTTRVNRYRVLATVAALLLIIASFAKLTSFSATKQYFETNLQAIGSASSVLLTVLIMGEALLAYLLLRSPTQRVGIVAGWVFIGFAGWHAAGLLMHASACPCFGPITAVMNKTTNQVVLGVACACVGMSLVLISQNQRSLT